mmetsp:Transcript_10023/g.31188  ORF Transcript_10023/g.31188 Transcript_10023/m.31188 type:complete len:342 (-) Transcript_10023:128-1153(-)
MVWVLSLVACGRARHWHLGPAVYVSQQPCVQLQVSKTWCIRSQAKANTAEREAGSQGVALTVVDRAVRGPPPNLGDEELRHHPVRRAREEEAQAEDGGALHGAGHLHVRVGRRQHGGDVHTACARETGVHGAGVRRSHAQDHCDARGLMLQSEVLVAIGHGHHPQATAEAEATEEASVRVRRTLAAGRGLRAVVQDPAAGDLRAWGVADLQCSGHAVAELGPDVQLRAVVGGVQGDHGRLGRKTASERQWWCVQQLSGQRPHSTESEGTTAHAKRGLTCSRKPEPGLLVLLEVMVRLLRAPHDPQGAWPRGVQQARNLLGPAVPVEHAVEPIGGLQGVCGR